MRLEMAFPRDAQEIARVYRDAFPESVHFFFRRKSPEKLLDLLELAFLTIFYWGGQAILVKDDQGSVKGYCFYLSQATGSHKPNGRHVVALLARMMRKITLPEITRLLHNQLAMVSSVKRIEKIPKAQAKILSVAINPLYQGQGLGTMLLEGVLAELHDQAIVLNVRAKNPAGRRLYAAAGFKQYGTTKDLSGEWIMLVKQPDY